MKKRIIGLLLGLTLAVSMTACTSQGTEKETEVISEEVEADTATEEKAAELEIEGASYVELSDEKIVIDGKEATANAEDAVYVANDIVYYEEGKDFTYGEGTEKDAHSKEEAEKHTVVHITKPGTYVLSGKLSAGQVAVDLGEDAKDDPEAVVTLVLNNVDITCTVAPGVIFYNVYECGSAEEETATKEVDTTAAGANVLIPDGTDNTVEGSYVARIYKSVELNEDGTEVVDSKKLHKYDGAFYSKMSMNVNGGEENTGRLNIYAENEGLDSELHLTMNGGTVNIISGNDGINTNEDNVSVTTINGGYLNIRVDGQTGEGDGIDSNGWLVINGGVVNAAACSNSMDAGIDSDKGIHINGGTVVASGNMLDRISDSTQGYVVFSFQDKIKGGEEISLVKGEESYWAAMPNDYTYLLMSKASFGEEGTYTLWKGEEQLKVVETSGGGMMMPGGFAGGEMPEGFEPGEMPEGFERGEMPEGFERGEMPEGFERGEMPEGFEPGEMLEGFERGEMPEGFDKGQRPGGGRGGFGSSQIDVENAVAEFEIKAEGNMYTVVSAAL